MGWGRGRTVVVISIVLVVVVPDGHDWGVVCFETAVSLKLAAAAKCVSVVVNAAVALGENIENSPSPNACCCCC